MAALTADLVTPRKDDAYMPHPDRYPVAAGETIFQGGLFVIDANGFAVPCAASDNRAFALIAVEQADNSAGADGAINVRGEFGAAYLLAITGTVLDRADIGAMVYGSDDQTGTLTAGTNTPLGPIKYFESTTEAWVHVRGPVTW